MEVVMVEKERKHQFNLCVELNSAYMIYAVE